MDLADMMKQAQAFQDQISDMQGSLEQEQVGGSSGGGLVSVTYNGKGELKAVAIDPSLVDKDEIAVLEDLIVAACADAKVKVEARVAEKMTAIAGGMGLPPGFKLPL